MQHIITDEEAIRYNRVFLDSFGGDVESNKAALADFLSNRPESTLGKLRPIAEMPETVPEGCVRLGWSAARGISFGGSVTDTHFIEVQLPTPDPEDVERQRFEQWALNGHASTFDMIRNQAGDYTNTSTYLAWKGWKAHAELAKAK